MLTKNLRLTLVSAVALGALSLLPAVAFADDDDPGNEIMTPTQVAMTQLQTDLQGLVSLSDPSATVSVQPISDDNPTSLEASIAPSDGSPAYDSTLDGSLIQALVAQAPMASQATASMDARDVRSDASALLHDLQSGPAVGSSVAPSSGPDDIGL